MRNTTGENRDCFKVEWEGDGIVSLCSKTYFCFGEKDKYSCKGVNKKNNVINKDKYLDVLLSKRSGSGVNRSFRVLNNTMCTYVKLKTLLVILILNVKFWRTVCQQFL